MWAMIEQEENTLKIKTIRKGHPKEWGHKNERKKRKKISQKHFTTGCRTMPYNSAVEESV